MKKYTSILMFLVTRLRVICYLGMVCGVMLIARTAVGEVEDSR